MTRYRRRINARLLAAALSVGFCLLVQTVKANETNLVIDRVCFFPAPGRERVTDGGKISRSNISQRSGFELVVEITTTPPAGHWSEISFQNTKLY
jgi:hypothetical protein